MAKNAKGLTPKQQEFVRKYLETGNASEAYRLAYDAKGMTPKVVSVKAAELLKNGKVTVAIAEAQQKLAEDHGVTLDRIIREYALVAFADPGDFFDWGPGYVTVKDKTELTPLQRRVISGAKQTTTKAGDIDVEVKLHCKLTALERLGKHLGMFKDIVEHDATDAWKAWHAAALAGKFARKTVDKNEDDNV